MYDGEITIGSFPPITNRFWSVASKILSFVVTSTMPVFVRPSDAPGSVVPGPV